MIVSHDEQIREIADRVAAVDQHYHQIAQHSPAVDRRAALCATRKRSRQTSGQADPIGQLGDRSGAHPTGQPVPVSEHFQPTDPRASVYPHPRHRLLRNPG